MEKIFKILNFILNVVIVLLIGTIFFWLFKFSSINLEYDIMVRKNGDYILKIIGNDDIATVMLEKNGENIYKDSLPIDSESNEGKYNFAVEWSNDKVNIKYINLNCECTYDKDILLDN